MKILIYVDKAFSLSETFIHKQVRCMKGHDVDLVCRKRLNSQHFDIPDSIKVKTLYQNLLYRFSFKIWKDKYNFPPIVQKFFRRKIQRREYDLVMCFYGSQGVKFLPILKNFTTPFYVSFHGFDATRKLNDPVYRQLVRQLFERSSCIKNPCHFLAQKVLDIGLEPSKSKVIHNGTSIEFIDNLSPDPSKRKSKIRLLHVGRLVPNKGIMDLLRVFERLTRNRGGEIELFIVGYGESEQKLKRFVAEKELQNEIKFLGAMHNSEVIRQMKNADIFILNSHTDDQGETEGFPNVILEAMACRLPIVSTVHAGIPEAIEDGVHGLLVPEKDHQALEKALVRYLDSEELRIELGENARKRVEKEFSEDQLCKNMNEVVQNLV